ncbi:hypothetical protein GPL21_32520 [Bradyrhizobium pachyrhizi]|uniref:Ubiquitin-like protease family profile domain-containing protein n=1 Tax=Bradyrhizobium pachyrhizi TaxID=280333 RepID=A0A844T420_9BRAD|nr:hypothetical protein [Bradyrhizobium pachyrhizi]MVT69811.1 hypothetical protein [Bradyrhizobium pachyrhizi]
MLSQELRDEGQLAPSRTPTDAGTDGVTPTTSVDGHSGQRLGLTECLQDEHIAPDYALVEEELYWNIPDLARQTGFVQPAQAQLLRLVPSESDRLPIVLQIFNEEDTDVANFLFVPVNDAGVEGGGSHWSLLLVDWRVPTAAVAYHYDSAGLCNSAVENSSQHVSAPAFKRDGWPSSRTAMNAESSWWTRRERRSDDWRKESGRTVSRCTSSASSPIDRHFGIAPGLIAACVDGLHRTTGFRPDQSPAEQRSRQRISASCETNADFGSPPRYRSPAHYRKQGQVRMNGVAG